jgi:hypothetical protein
MAAIDSVYGLTGRSASWRRHQGERIAALRDATVAHAGERRFSNGRGEDR